jgi:hypothetical protein
MNKRLTTYAELIKSNAAAAQTAVVLGIQENPHFVNWLKQFNSLKNDFTEAMDQGWVRGGIDADTGLKFTPSNHRILDEGHTISGSMGRGRAHRISDSARSIRWGEVRHGVS